LFLSEQVARKVMYQIRPSNVARIATRAVSALTWQSNLLPTLEICNQLPGTLRQAANTLSSHSATGPAAGCLRYSLIRGFASETAPEEPMFSKDEKVKVPYYGCAHLLLLACPAPRSFLCLSLGDCTGYGASPVVWSCVAILPYGLRKA
jgi:hypothetical protein